MAFVYNAEKECFYLCGPSLVGSCSLAWQGGLEQLCNVEWWNRVVVLKTYGYGTEISFLITICDLYFSTTTLLILHKYCQMAPPHKFMPPPFSLSFLVSSSSRTATALTEPMSESVPFFFCSDFPEGIFVDLKWKRFLAMVGFEP